MLFVASSHCLSTVMSSWNSIALIPTYILRLCSCVSATASAKSSGANEASSGRIDNPAAPTYTASAP